MDSYRSNSSSKVKIILRDKKGFDVPVECIRRTRCLNVDKNSTSISQEVYKILKSNNGRKIFT